MDALRKHEVFEIELLDTLKKANFLKPLIFTGGTMLRLCYELGRYSTDLDFWFVKSAGRKQYFLKLKKFLSGKYEITDAQEKFNTFIIEIRSGLYPKRLKLEIRKHIRKCDYEDRIAFSKYSTMQVILRVHTLKQMMQNKIEAALSRKDIRDFFDLEFLLRQGAGLQATKAQREQLRQAAANFKARDFKVTLGSVLDTENRKYYVLHGLDYLMSYL